MVIEKIFEHARNEPGKLAISYYGNSISYGEFASCIAHAQALLRRQDLPVGRIAVLLDVTSRPDSWSFDLALRSLGMTTVAVRDPETLEQLGLKDIGCVVTTIEDPTRIVHLGANFKIVRIPQHFYLNNRPKTLANLPAITPSLGGHILLTSGTTGVSKKVLVEESGIENVARRRAELCGISKHSIVNIFGYALWTGMGYYLPACVWSAGSTVIFHQGTDAYLSLQIEGITHAFLTPVDLTDLVRAPVDQIRRHEAMKLYVTGGPLPRDLASKAKEILTPRIFTYVASTEVGPWTLTRIDRPEDLRSHRIEPLVDVQVVDESNRPLPAGQIGAVRVRALPGVSGYLDDEDASRAFFRDGYFYPGDLGAFQTDGRLVLHGRITNVINILGEKIAVEKAEQALQDRLSVDGVCILLRNEGGDDRLHILIQSSGAPIGRAELQSAIYAELPAGMPAVVHFVAELPRNDLGKIDRAALAGWKPASLVNA